MSMKTKYVITKEDLLKLVASASETSVDMGYAPSFEELSSEEGDRRFFIPLIQDKIIVKLNN